MKTKVLGKKILSVVLILGILMSCFTCIGMVTYSAAGTVSFTDNQGWGNNNGVIYAYFWSDSKKDIGGQWPGTKMGNAQTNSLGQTVYSVTIPDGATYVIFNNNSDQTVDTVLGSYDGYYTDGERDKEKNHLVTYGWNYDDSADSGNSGGSTVGTTSGPYNLADDIQDGVILHCFDWKYNDIKAELKNIAEAGFSAVQTSPAQRANGGTWYWLYQPRDFKIETNELGTKAELEALCTEAEKYGIKVVVDVVANHLEGDHSYIAEYLRPAKYWHTYGDVSNWKDRYQVTHGDIGMQDLATENSEVQQFVKAYIDELKSVGVDGIRFDAAKHIGLPSEEDNFWKVVTSDRDLWYYGEILGGPYDGGGDNLMKEYTNYISVTDDSYGTDVRNSFAGGHAPESYGNWSARGLSNNKILYWAESHDTYSNGPGDNVSYGISQNNIDRAYAVVGSRADATALYFSRPSSTDKESIKQGVKGSTHFTSPEVAAVNHFHNAMIGQKEYYTTSDNCSVVCREQGAVIVAGSGSNKSVSVTNGGGTTKPGTYTDEITGNTWTVTSTTISGKIGSSGIAVIYNPKSLKPSASVSPSSQNYKSDTLKLTLKYTNATSGEYSIDNGAYKTFTNGQTITIGEGLPYGTVTKISVKATDGSVTSDPVTYTYTKVDPAKTVRIYFDNSTYKWTNVYTYVYIEDEDGKEENAVWPGVEMQYDSDLKLYYYDVPENLENGLAIFTESSDATNNRYPADGERGMEIGGTSKIFRANHEWKDYTPPTTEPTTAEPTTAEPTTEAPTTEAPTTEESTTVETTTEPATEPETKPAIKILIGDADLDGEITIMDTTLIQRYTAGYEEFNEIQLIAADCNGDGIVSIPDATLIQLYLAEYESEDVKRIGTYVIYTPEPDPEPTTEEPTTEEPTEAPTTAAPKTRTILFTNSKNWSEVYVHYWGGSEATEWPGLKMTYVGENNYGQKQYSAEVPVDTTGMVFTAGKEGPQTVNVDYDNNVTGWYIDTEKGTDGEGHYYVKSWTDEKEPETTAPVTVSPTTAEPTEAPKTRTILFTNSKNWSEVYVHYWGGSAATDWPGLKMTYVGENNYGQKQYSAEVPVDTTGMVFTAGEKGPQTVNVDYDNNVTGWYIDTEKGTDGEGHYYVKSWTDEEKETTAPATAAPTTVVPTTVAPTTAAPTTVATTTVAPTTVVPTTVVPTTVAPTTVAPTTVPQSNALSKDYYLIGYINGKDYGDKDDHANLGDYHFDKTTGKVTVTFTSASYVCTKTSDMVWYMTNGWAGEVKEVTLYESGPLGEKADKLFVPAGKVEFTLVENKDGTLTLSYVVLEEAPTTVPPETESTTKAETEVLSRDYYLIGYFDGKNYGCEGDSSNLGDYKFDRKTGKVTATFKQTSYAFVKTGDNKDWFMTNGFPGMDVTEATLYNTTITGEKSNKLCVQAGTVEFTLVENKDGTLTLSYVVLEEAPTTVPPATEAPTTAPSTSAGKNYVYLNANATDGDGAVWYAWTWNTGSEARWVKGVAVGNLFRFDEPDENIIFVRMNPSGNLPSWDDDTKWNQTADLVTELGKTYTTKSWDDGKGKLSGSWG